MLNFGKLDEKLLTNKQKKINRRKTIAEKKKLYKKVRKNKQKKIKKKRKKL